MHIAIATVFAPYAFKKGSIYLWGEKKVPDWKVWK